MENNFKTSSDDINISLRKLHDSTQIVPITCLITRKLAVVSNGRSSCPATRGKVNPERYSYENLVNTEKCSEPGPVKLNRGKIIAKRWKVRSKLGEGGCGAVYKVEDLHHPGELAALKAESNFVAGGSVLKLEAQILKRMEGKRHVAQLLHSGKKTTFCYMVMTLFGESLSHVVKKLKKDVSLSSQTRIGINVLYGLKQIHDIGYVHRDLKPANIAIGRSGTVSARFLHILDFGLAREYVVKDEADGKLKMRRPRQRALFRGTTRYCSIATHDRLEQGRVDDLWSLVYMLAELRGPLPWSTCKDKKEVAEIKRATEPDMLLENSPIQLVQFAKHLSQLNYYSRPDYFYLYKLLKAVQDQGKFKFTDMYDWEKKGGGASRERTQDRSAEIVTLTTGGLGSKEVLDSKEVTMPLSIGIGATGKATPQKETEIDPENPFPEEFFRHDPIGF